MGWDLNLLELLGPNRHNPSTQLALQMVRRIAEEQVERANNIMVEAENGDFTTSSDGTRAARGIQRCKKNG